MNTAQSTLPQPIPGPDFDRFLAMWAELPRRTHPFLPTRKDCTPVRLGTLMPNTGIGRYDGPGKMEVLYYGTELERASGLKVTGMNYYDLLPQEFHAPMAKFHALIFGTPCGAYIGDFVKTQAGHRYLYESLQFPLAGEDDTPRYMLVYGLARKPLADQTERDTEGHNRRAIKDMRYIDLGAGAPTARIEDFIFYR